MFFIIFRETKSIPLAIPQSKFYIGNMIIVTICVEAFVERHSIKYECCPEIYVDLTVTLRVQRRALYFFFNLIKSFKF